MNILFLTNNIDVSKKLYDWVYEKEHSRVFLYQEKISKKIIIEKKINFIISYNYKSIISSDVINMKLPIINLHISYLPYNRGMYPNVWSFIDNTPKGITIHYVDEGLDTGPILFQKEVFFEEQNETLLSTYRKLHEEMFDLFVTNWDYIKNNRVNPIPQNGKGTFHYKKEFDEKILPLIKDKGWEISIYELKERYQRKWGSK